MKGFDLGAVDYIEKPFSVATLRAKIESIIALRDRQERKDCRLIRSSISRFYLVIFSEEPKTRQMS